MQLIVLVLFSIPLIWFGIRMGETWLQRTGDPDSYLFALAGTGFIMTGGAMLYFALWYYRKMQRFYQEDAWYGIVLDDRKISCKAFDVFRKRAWSAGTEEIVETQIIRLKMREYLLVKTQKKMYTIDLGLLLPEDQAHLRTWLKV